MNTRIRPAVRWRAGVTSLQMWAQMAIRMLVIAAALWATSAVALVWYWSGRYGGWPAHRYFGRWILAWIFTQMLPLSFLPLPYRGVRYQAASMYEFLNRRFYFGHPFPVWFVHYSLWALMPTGLALFAVGGFFFPRRLDAADDEYVRGTDVIPARKLARELKGDGVGIGGVKIPRSIESQHLLFVGSPGSGKSTTIRSLLRQIEARGETAIVLDSECEYVPEFFRPERGDLILNPLDVRCPGWTPWAELRPESEAMDSEALASALLPDPANPFGQSGADFFFRESARTLIVGLFDIVRTGDPADIPKLLGLPRVKLKEALRGIAAEALIDPGAHDQGAGIVATAFNATKAFHHLPPPSERQWSALEWAESRRGWLFLSSTEDSRDAASPLQSVWLDCLVRRLMAAQESREQIWIIADELPVLRRQAQLESLVVRGRKRGLCAVLGFQAITQLRALYGRDQTATMVAAPATKLILRTGEPETARWSSEQIGEREVSRTQVGASAGPREMRDGFTIHPQRVVEKAALPSEIQMLQPFQGYLCITGHRRAIVEFSYLNPIKRQPGFVQRLTTNEEPEAESAPASANGPPETGAGVADGCRVQAASRTKRPLA